MSPYTTPRAASPSIARPVPCLSVWGVDPSSEWESEAAAAMLVGPLYPDSRRPTKARIAGFRATPWPEACDNPYGYVALARSSERASGCRWLDARRAIL